MISKKSVSALFALVLLLISCSAATDYGALYPYSYQTPYSDRYSYQMPSLPQLIHLVLLLSISLPVFRRLRLQWSVSLPVFL